MRLVYLFCILFLVSCVNQKYVERKIKINTQNGEECFYFLSKKDTLKFDRQIRITKNTLSDTILFGYGILVPQQLGIVGYAKLENRDGLVLDLRYKNPKTDKICISPYKGKKVKGILIIELDTLESY